MMDEYNDVNFCFVLLIEELYGVILFIYEEYYVRYFFYFKLYNFYFIIIIWLNYKKDIDLMGGLI